MAAGALLAELSGQVSTQLEGEGRGHPQGGASVELLQVGAWGTGGAKEDIELEGGKLEPSRVQRNT